MVPKSQDGEWRVCGDYRALNAVTRDPPRQVYHPQICWTSTPRSTAGRFFSKIDLLQAFHQINKMEDDALKTVVTTTCGLFKYLFREL